MHDVKLSIYSNFDKFVRDIIKQVSLRGQFFKLKCTKLFSFNKIYSQSRTHSIFKDREMNVDVQRAGPTAGDLVPGVGESEKKKKKMKNVDAYRI